MSEKVEGVKKKGQSRENVNIRLKTKDEDKPNKLEAHMSLYRSPDITKSS